jgi:ABC-type nitrate/sulfonate/bicarbonate transport system permease component
VTRFGGPARRVIVLVAAIAAWQTATMAADDLFFPTPWQIARQAWMLWFTTDAGTFGLAATVGDDMLPSLGRVLAGWVVAAVLGVAAGTALGRSRTGMDYLGGLFAFLRTLPSVALLPVFVALLGLRPAMGLALIISGSIWPILLNTVDGVRSVHPLQADTARSFRISRTQWITLVVLPAALPKIFAGLRVSLSIALILMAISELVGTTNGIGYQLINAKNHYDITSMWAWIVLFGVFGYALNTALLTIQHRLLRWQPRHTERTTTRS